MKLFDLFENDFGANAVAGLDDQLLIAHLDDTRKPKITLLKLNKLRKLRELKKFQDIKNSSLVAAMYTPDDSGPAF